MKIPFFNSPLVQSVFGKKDAGKSQRASSEASPQTQQQKDLVNLGGGSSKLGSFFGGLVGKTQDKDLHLDWLSEVSESSQSKFEAKEQAPDSSWGLTTQTIVSGQQIAPSRKILTQPISSLQENSGVQQTQSLGDYSVDNPPPAKLIEEKVFAVHATAFMPERGVLRAGARDISGDGPEIGNEPPSFRPTLHFSLGELVRDHGRSSWEDKPFAVLMPIGKLKEQLVNVNPYDTFTVGDLELPQGSTLLVPEGTKTGELPEGVKVKSYPKEQSLRQAVNDAIEETDGWKFDMRSGGVSLDEKATWQGKNINKPAFFSNFLAENPKVGYGSHVNSSVGEGHRFGAIEQTISGMMKEMKSGFPSATRPLYRKLLSHHSAKLQEFMKDMPENSQASVKEKLSKVANWTKLIDLDTRLRDSKGLTFAGNKEVLAKLEACQGDPKSMDSVVKTCADQLRKATPYDPPSVSGYSEALHSLPPHELKEFMTAHPGEFSELKIPEFYASYAISRSMLVEPERAGSEGLESLLTKSLNKLDVSEKGTQLVTDNLSDYLNENSSRLPDALRLLEKPAVRKHLTKNEGISLAEEGPISLEDVISGDQKCTALNNPPSEKPRSPMEMVAADIQRRLSSPSAKQSEPISSLSRARSRSFYLEHAAKSRESDIQCLLTPINSARNSHEIAAGDRLTLYEQQRRQPASEIWEKLGLKDAFTKKFPEESQYWSSQQSFVELHLELSAERNP